MSKSLLVLDYVYLNGWEGKRMMLKKLSPDLEYLTLLGFSHAGGQVSYQRPIAFSFTTNYK